MLSDGRMPNTTKGSDGGAPFVGSNAMRKFASGIDLLSN
jgi:hypothetical protein